MATEHLKKFAEELKSARENKDISLKQITIKTKIDIKFLQAIEEGNFAFQPEIYIKAFIKEYCQTLELNVKDHLQKFEIAFTGKSEEKKTDPGNDQVENTKPVTDNDLKTSTQKEFDSTHVYSPTEVSQQKPQLKINYVFSAVIALVVLIVVYLIFFSNDSKEIISEKANQETAAENSQRFEMDNKNQQYYDSIEIKSSLQIPDSLRLNVQVSERVWIKVTCDGKLKIQQIVDAKSNLNFAATKSFSISMGNAGLVKLFYNNKPVENVGKLGEIRNIFITPDNIRYYTIPSQSKNE